MNSQTKGWVDFKQVSSSTFAIQEGLNVYAYYPYEENEAQVSGTTDGTADSRAAVSSNWAGTRNLEVPAEQQQVAGDDFSNLAKYYALAAVPTTVVNDTGQYSHGKTEFLRDIRAAPHPTGKRYGQRRNDRPGRFRGSPEPAPDGALYGRPDGEPPIREYGLQDHGP